MKVVKTISTLLLGTAIASVGNSSAQSAVLFQDNFDSENTALPTTTLTNWNVTSGNVDVIGSGVFDFYPGNGNYLDMDGTTNATIETKQLFNLTPGTYQLSFKIGNNTFNAPANSLLVQLGSAFSESFNAPTPTASSPAPLISITRLFTITTPTLAKLSFAETGTSDFGGSVLDAVVLEQTQAVPIPTPGLLPGLIGIGVAAFRRHQSEQVGAEAP